MANMNSDFVEAYLTNRGKLRQQYYRGQLLHTSIYTHDLNSKVKDSESDWPKADVGSILAVTLIPFRASIKRVEFQADTDLAQLEFNVGIAGIGVDNTLVVIKDDVYETSATGEKDDIYIAWNHLNNRKTIFELLHDANKNPLDAFKPFINDKYGILIFKVTTKEEDNTPRNTCIDIDWTEQSPSDMSAFSPIIPGSFHNEG